MANLIIATKEDAHDIGGKGTSSKWCIKYSELTTYGCELNSAGNSVGYTSNQLVAKSHLTQMHGLISLSIYLSTSPTPNYGTNFVDYTNSTLSIDPSVTQVWIIVVGNYSGNPSIEYESDKYTGPSGLSSSVVPEVTITPSAEYLRSSGSSQPLQNTPPPECVFKLPSSSLPSSGNSINVVASYGGKSASCTIRDTFLGTKYCRITQAPTVISEGGGNYVFEGNTKVLFDIGIANLSHNEIHGLLHWGLDTYMVSVNLSSNEGGTWTKSGNDWILEIPTDQSHFTVYSTPNPDLIIYLTDGYIYTSSGYYNLILENPMP